MIVGVKTDKMKIKLTNLLRKGVETAGETAGQVVRGTAKGVYKGLTAQTDDDLAERKARRELSNRINARSSSISRWAWLLTVAAFCGVTFYFLGEAKFNSSNLSEIVLEKWPYYLAIIVANIFVNSFSKQFAEETIR